MCQLWQILCFPKGSNSVFKHYCHEYLLFTTQSLQYHQQQRQGWGSLTDSTDTQASGESPVVSGSHFTRQV